MKKHSGGGASRLRIGLKMLALAIASLQLYFLFACITLNWWQPPSTSFQRTALWENLRRGENPAWLHQPVPSRQISNNIRRAVIASEDNRFYSHHGVDWNAMQHAWENNQDSTRVLGGSTLTQQLAKNLYLSGQRTLLRKGQELLLAWMLEATLSKERILNLYLNQVEWGRNLYGIEAASRHYFDTSAAALSASQAARLAVMLPQPRHLERNIHSAYMNQRTGVIVRRMGDVRIPESGLSR